MIITLMRTGALQADVELNKVTGPAIACGAAFSVELRSGEALEWRDTRMDFVTYRFRQGETSTVIYEGNAPQPGGIMYETGKIGPSKIVVHGNSEVAARLRFDDALRNRCPSETPRW